MKNCPFCGKAGVEKKIFGSLDSTMDGMEIGKGATCTNKECEISSHLFSVETWENRVELKETSENA